MWRFQKIRKKLGISFNNLSNNILFPISFYTFVQPFWE